MKWSGTRASVWVFAAGVVFSLTGCNSQGVVNGKVTIDGAPLPGGLVAIHDAEGQIRTTKVNPDGTYSVSNVAPGKAVATVQTMEVFYDMFTDPAKAPKNSPFGQYRPIPQKYAARETSGLSLEVKTGKQEYDIPLKDEPKQETK
jgi:hypothetical protein